MLPSNFDYQQTSLKVLPGGAGGEEVGKGCGRVEYGLNTVYTCM
jgi:hypothetical protein